MADPAGKERRQQMGPGESPAHLENCTGKKLISAKVESEKWKIPVRSGSEKTEETQIKKIYSYFSIVLGR